jgi:hypothetical protein
MSSVATTLAKTITEFDPRAIPGCVVWLDAADTSSCTPSTAGSSVTAWVNKVDGTTFTNTGSSVAPVLTANVTNGRSALLFNGTKYIARSLTISSPYTYFCVAQQTVNTADYQRIINAFTPVYSDACLFVGVSGPNVAMFTGNGPTWNDVAAQTPTVTSLNVWLVYTGVASGVNLISYTTGTAANIKVGTVSAVSLSGLNIGGGISFGGVGAQPFRGYVGEIIFYNYFLPTAQRQMVEAYLAWKWGIQANLPSTHPNFRLAPRMRRLNPSDIDSLQLWLDALDASTVTTSGTNVTNVRDKSPLNWTLSNATGFTYPNNSFNGTYPSFLGTATNLNPTYSLGVNVSFAQRTPFTIITVVDATVNQSGFITDSVGGVYREYIWTVGGATPYVSPATTQLLNPTILTTVWIAGTNTSFTYYNGSNASTYTGTLAAGTTDGITIGNRYTLNQGWPGHICEILFYGRTLTSQERSQVEGYLMWKWGLRSTFNASHPYYNRPPFIPITFTPTDIQNCQLWIDATQDTAANGAFVNTITDRSGNGNNLTATTTNTITLVQNSQNNNSVYNFAGNRASNASFLWGNTFTHIQVSQSTNGVWLNSSGTLTRYIGLGNWALAGLVGPGFLDTGSITATSQWTTSGTAPTIVSARAITLPAPTVTGQATSTYSVAISASRSTSFSCVLPAAAGTSTYFGLSNGTTTLEWRVTTSGTTPNLLRVPNGNTLTAAASASVYVTVSNSSITTNVFTGSSFTRTDAWTNSGAGQYVFFFRTKADGTGTQTSAYTEILYDPGKGNSVLPASTGLANAWSIFSFGYTGGTSLAKNYTVNGAVRNTFLWLGSQGQTAGTALPLYINGNNSGAYDTTTIGEVIHYNYELTTYERQVLEGYLAWKWGLQRQLPSTHPYTKYPPAQLFGPKIIVTTGLLLNLDPSVNIFSGSTWRPTEGNTWTVYNTPTTATTDGKGTAVVLTGASSQYCMDQTGIANPQAYSIDVWFLATSLQSNNVVSEMGQAGSPGTGYNWTVINVTSGGTIYAGPYTLGFTTVNLGTYAANTWYHVCITNSAGVSLTNTSSTLTAYVNGILKTSATYTRYAPSSSFYCLGGPGNQYFGYFTGQIGALKIYNTVLTAAQVKQNYNALCGRFGLAQI